MEKDLTIKLLAEKLADDLKKYKSLNGNLNILNPQNVYFKIHDLEEINYSSLVTKAKQNKTLEEQYQEITKHLGSKINYLYKMLDLKQKDFSKLTNNQKQELINEGYEICFMNNYL